MQDTRHSVRSKPRSRVDSPTIAPATRTSVKVAGSLVAIGSPPMTSMKNRFACSISFTGTLKWAKLAKRGRWQRRGGNLAAPAIVERRERQRHSTLARPQGEVLNFCRSRSHSKARANFPMDRENRAARFCNCASNHGSARRSHRATVALKRNPFGSTLNP